MPERIPQSVAIRVPLQAYLASDHVSPATGKTIAITISKNGAAYGNPSGGATNATEIASGSYYVDLSTTDAGTVGPLFVKGAEGTIDTIIAIYDVVKATNGGWTALPDTAVTTNASLLTSGTGTDQVSVSGGKVLLQATQSGVTIPTVTTVTNQLTAAQIATGVWQDATAGDFTVVSSIGKSLYTSGNAPGAASGLALVGSNMGTVTSVSGAVGSVTGAVGSVTGNVGGNVTGSVGSVTGNVGGNVVGSVGSVTAGVIVTTNNDKTGYTLTVTPPTAAQIVTAIWTDLLASSDFATASSIGKLLKDDIDAAISTRGTGTALDAAGVRTAVGLATANLDTQLTALQSDTDDIQTRIPATLSAGGFMMSDVEEVLGTAAQPTGITIRKNVALANFEFPMFDATDGTTPLPGLTITATMSLDGAAFAPMTNTATEVGSGVYKINLAAADTNADTVTYMFDGGPTAKVLLLFFTTQP